MPLRRALDQVEPYRPQRPMHELQRELGLERLVKLASNEGAFGPLPAAVAAFEAAAGSLNRYPDGGGVRLREELAGRHKLPVEQVVLGNGADELIRLCAVATLDAGDRAVLPWPSFPSYVVSAASAGAEPVAVPLNGRKVDLDRLVSEAHYGAKLIYLPNPNNPTGVLLDRADVRRLLDEVPPDVLVVLDEAYAEYADPEPEGPPLLRDGHERLCVLRTFSKVYGLASLRVGYALASPAIADGLDRVRPIFNVNQPAQEAALASLHEQHAIGGRVKHAREAREDIRAALASVGLDPEPSQANFVYADVPGGDSVGLADRLLRAGFIVRELTGFGAPGAIRVTAGTDEENALFAEALKTALPEPIQSVVRGRARMRRSTIAIFLCLVFAAPAAAKWGQPVEPGNSGVHYFAPQAATDESGAGVVAWEGPEFDYGGGGRTYVVAALRGPDGTIGPVEELNDYGVLTDVAVGGDGRRAVLLRAEVPHTESLIAVSDGGAFTVERVPLPENQAAFGMAVEVHDDGSLTVLWDQSASESTAHLYAIRRAPDGSWAEAQQITQEKQEFGSFTSLIDASGTTWAFWTGKADPSDPHVWAVFATYAPPGGQFSAPAQISDPHRGMRVVGDRLPALANSRGDVAVLDDAEMLLKAPGPGWFGSAGAPAGYASSMHTEADLALDDEGNIYLAWRAGDVLGAFRPADGTFGRPEVLARNTGTQAPPMLAFDGRGDLIYADNSEDGVIARVRPPDGSFSEPELIAPEGVWAYELGRPVAAGADGLLLPWVTGAKPMSPGYDTTPHVAQFTTWTPLADQPAPVVRRLRPAGRTMRVTSARRKRARRAAFRFKLSERARVSLVFERKVTGKRFAGACYAPWAKVTGGPCDTWIPFGGAVARKGTKGLNAVRLTRAQTKGLATLPEVRLVVAATDRKHKRSRERRLTFRVG